MKRVLFGILAIALAAGLLIPSPAAAQQYRYWWQVVNNVGDAYPRATVLCSVYGSGAVSEALATAHVFTTLNDPTTGTTSPLVSTVVGNVFEFYWTDNTSSFDVACYSRAGGRARVTKLNRFTHRIVLDQDNYRRVSRFAFHSDGNTGQTLTDVLIPQGAVIRDVIINVTSWGEGASTAHINVGTAGNHVGGGVTAFAIEQALNSHGVGWVRPHAVVRTGGVGTGGGGGGNSYLGNHRGAALSYYHQSICLGGNCGAVAGGSISNYQEVPFVVHVAGGIQVAYQMSSQLRARLNGHVYIIWDEFHVGANRWGLGE